MKMGNEGEAADPGCRRPPIFYRMIVPSIVQDKKLRVQGKFLKKLGNELPAVATLTTPNGCNWQVGLEKIDDKVWFTEGWHEFVKHQSIRVGYLLLFVYVGNLNFHVNIFDLGAAEIRYQCKTPCSSGGPSCSNRCRVPYKEEAEHDDSVEILGSFPTCQKPTSLEAKLNRSGIAEPQYKADGGTLHLCSVSSAARSTRDVGIQCGYSELMTAAYETRLHCLSRNPELSRKRKRGIGSTDGSALLAKSGSEVQTPGSETTSGTLLRSWRVVTPEEKDRVLNESKTFHSENPFCRVFLRRSYVYKGIGLHMPSSFAEKYLGGVSGFITLQASTGEKWPVRCMWSNGSAKLSKGWPEFVRDNVLEEGDVCVFELIKTEEIVLKVTIFRLVEDAEPVNQIPKEKLARVSKLSSGYDLNG
ncbi:B3 domain-containing transcription factor VRN1-like isoform X1 [Rhododendron vialii]|uniref:B3 domain-containing transcription factor VRN1-like isoform X1 n=1 Tax=Rhododendron vialii TaxID=182163 RepID=UPI00265F9720|nr:B3 domain-containing transcription factor VRN1-like isoform X1 [Rhododendron vialii]